MTIKEPLSSNISWISFEVIWKYVVCYVLIHGSFISCHLKDLNENMISYYFHIKGIILIADGDASRI